MKQSEPAINGVGLRAAGAIKPYREGRSRLRDLSDHGQSVWIDYLSRDLLETGELARLIDRYAVVGVTSNPTIFQKAISGGSAYNAQLKETREQSATRRSSSTSLRRETSLPPAICSARSGMPRAARMATSLLGDRRQPRR